MSVDTVVKRHLSSVAKTVVPERFWRRKVAILSQLAEERPDVRLVASLCDPDRLSVDIGADVGEFSIAMANNSKAVMAFEPRPAMARELTTMFTTVMPKVRVQPVALSSEPGTLTMRVLASEPGRSTIESGNPLIDLDGTDVQAIQVPVKTLDEYRLDNVGCIKVDVEGHELAVLQGAIETIKRNRPALVIEAEDRHHPNAVAEVTEFLTGLGYQGTFDDESGKRHPIERFDPARHQNPANVGRAADGWTDRGYINNFIFKPAAA